MHDNWSFVFAAYLLTAAAFAGYWRRLRKREREMDGGRPTRQARP
jgi:hypothetical protein